MKILIVDDSVTLRKIVLRSLRKHGYDDLEEAADGQAAIDLLKKNHYECIFLDINMPHVDGLEVLGWLAKSKKHTAIHIIVMSTEVINFSPRQIVDLGIHTVIPKPFTGVEFEKAAISLLNIIQSVDEMMPLVYDGPILIIEDNMTMRSILRKQLFHLNCLNIEEARNGKEGLEKINEWVMLDTGDEKLGIVFLDLVMPVMDGIALIEILEQKQLISKLQIIVISGEVEMAADMVDGVTIMAALPKPFVYEQFIKAFSPLVNRTRQACINPVTNEQLFLDSVLPELPAIEVMSIAAVNIEDFCSTLFLPAQAIVLGMAFPKERSKKISKEVFTFLIEAVYRPVLTVDHNTSLYYDLINLYDKLRQISQYEEKIRAISNEVLDEYCKRILLPKDPEYVKLSKEKNTCKLTIMKLTEEESEFKSEYETSKSDEIKEAYEKRSEELSHHRAMLETHENTLVVLKKRLEVELFAACNQQIALQLNELEVIADQMRAAFDRSLWRRMRTSTDYREYVNCSNRHVELSSENWLSDEGLLESEWIQKFFKEDYTHTIVLVGFSSVDGKELQHHLSKLFPSYTIYVHASLSIQNLLIPSMPSLFIFNREEKKLDIESFVNDAADYFEVASNEVNTLILYYRAFSGEEIVAKNSVYSLKLKNYMKYPKNKQDFTLMSIKIKSLLF